MQLLSLDALKAQSLIGDSLARKRRRLRAFADAACTRVQKLCTILDRDDPIAVERYDRDQYWRGVQHQGERAKTAVAQMTTLLRKHPAKSE